MATLLETLMQKVKANITEINKDELQAKISENQGLAIIDVRGAENWQEANIPNSIHCERGMLELKIEKLIPNLEQEIVIYCGGGTRSALSAESLQNMGYSNIKSLAEGFRGWENANLPTGSSNT